MRKELEDRVFDFYHSWPVFDVLTPLRADFDRQWFKCPFGCDCAAYVRNKPIEKTFDVSAVYCPICDKHGWFDVAGAVKSSLYAEEVKMREILARFDGLDERSVSPEEACMMWHSQGLPEELAADVATDPNQFWQLVAEHKSKSKNNFKRVYE